MNTKRITGIIAVLFCFTTAVYATDVLDIGVGAKSIGLGKTFTSVQSDAYGIFGNPASLTGIMTGEIVSMYGNMDSDVTYTLLGYVYPTQFGNFSLGYGNNSVTGITSTTLDASSGRPAAVSNLDFRNDLMTLGYQNNYSSNISYGVRAKYLSKGISNTTNGTGTGINADAGLLINAYENLNIGLVANNILPGGKLNLQNGQSEDIPATLTVGLGYKALSNLDLYSDLLLNKDIPGEIKVGVDWRVLDRLSLRAGADELTSALGTSYTNGSVGLGINLGILGIDYAYYYDSMLVSNSRSFLSISILMQNMFPKQPEKKIEVYVPPPPPEPLPVVVPPPAPIVEAPPEPAIVGEYVIKKHDTLKSISFKFFHTRKYVWKIANDNNIKNPNWIYPGQKIVIKK